MRNFVYAHDFIRDEYLESNLQIDYNGIADCLPNRIRLVHFQVDEFVLNTPNIIEKILSERLSVTTWLDYTMKIMGSYLLKSLLIF